MFIKGMLNISYSNDFFLNSHFLNKKVIKIHNFFLSVFPFSDQSKFIEGPFLRKIGYFKEKDNHKSLKAWFCIKTFHCCNFLRVSIHLGVSLP